MVATSCTQRAVEKQTWVEKAIENAHAQIGLEIDTIESMYPKKFEPVSPINVFAGEKLNGKNPTSAPINDVIINIAIIGE